MVIEWAKKPMTGRYVMADRLPPSLARSHAFRTLNCRTLCTVTQARTGHGQFGEYYQISEARINLQSKDANTSHSTEPTLAYCRGRAPDYQLTTLLGTKKGIQVWAEFVSKSGAFQKPKTPMTHGPTRTTQLATLRPEGSRDSRVM